MKTRRTFKTSDGSETRPMRREFRTNRGVEVIEDVDALRRDYSRLWADLEATGLSEITASSCIQNGEDTTMEHGVAPADREAAAMFYAVQTASFYELPGF